MMKKLFERNELAFALVWIVLYVVMFGNAGALTASAVTNYALQAVVGLVMVAVLLIFARKKGLMTYWGLVPFGGSWRKMLWFVPLIIAMSENIWLGFGLREDGALATVLGVAAIGVLAPIMEELTMRGLLYRAMGRENALRAFIVCSLTFGVGHLANLAFGQDVVYTLVQVVYAICIGFCFMAVFHTGKSLLPSIIGHIEMNSLSFFCNAGTAGSALDYLTVVVMCVICVGYGAYLLWAYHDERPLSSAPLVW